MSVWANKSIVGADEIKMSPFELVNVVSGMLGVSDFIKDRPGNVFFSNDWRQNFIYKKYFKRPYRNFSLNMKNPILSLKVFILHFLF